MPVAGTAQRASSKAVWVTRLVSYIEPITRPADDGEAAGHRGASCTAALSDTWRLPASLGGPCSPSERFGEPLLQLKSVRYMSVTNVAQRRLLTGNDTR